MGAFLQAFLGMLAFSAGGSVISDVVVPYLSGERDLPEIQQRLAEIQARNQTEAIRRKAMKEKNKQTIEAGIGGILQKADLAQMDLMGSQGDKLVNEAFDLGTPEIEAAAPAEPRAAMEASSINGSVNPILYALMSGRGGSYA